MPSNLRHPNRWAIFLLLTLLSLQVGARMNLCLMPDGDVHVKETHSPCDLTESQSTPEPLISDNHHLDNQAHLDIAIEESTSVRYQKDISQHPAPAITPLGEPITLAQTKSHRLLDFHHDISPQLLPLRSVAILRI